MPAPLRVAYTLEQCWHDVPGGTAVATLEVLARMAKRPDVEIVGVAGRHRRPPAHAFVPPVDVARLPFARPWLYESWNRFEWPPVERATGPVDICHSTTAIPAASRAPRIVTVHDAVFVRSPELFTRHGARVMNAGLERCRRAELVLCPSATTAAELADLGFDRARLRVVPWGVERGVVADADLARVRAAYRLPDRYVLFVGTIEPRKNLPRLLAAVHRLDPSLPLVIAGADGWGDGVGVGDDQLAQFLGFVPRADLPALYAAAAVFGYPSLQEGFGMPIAEAMAQGTPVVTSAGGATEEVAGGAAVLVDPLDESAIAAGLERALTERDDRSAAGRARAAELTWDATVEATLQAYREVAG
jgi:glycosyltransferase involved in cell wall biosynthesis